jgi:mannan endo-1,4-beta-mannosidase
MESSPEDYYSIRWTGYLLPITTATHVIRLEADYAASILVNGELLIDRWSATSSVAERAQIFLSAGQPVPFEIRYRHQAGISYIRVYWSSTSFQDQVIPASTSNFENFKSSTWQHK